METNPILYNNIGIKQFVSKKYHLILSLFLIGLFSVLERCTYYSVNSGVDSVSYSLGLFKKNFISISVQVFTGEVVYAMFLHIYI